MQPFPYPPHLGMRMPHHPFMRPPFMMPGPNPGDNSSMSPSNGMNNGSASPGDLGATRPSQPGGPIPPTGPGMPPPFATPFPGTFMPPPGFPPFFAPPGVAPPASQPPATAPPAVAPPAAFDPNCWVETRSPEGKAYYYHYQTRETRWERPNESGVRVLTQTELEQALAASASFPPFGMPPPFQNAALPFSNVHPPPYAGVPRSLPQATPAVTSSATTASSASVTSVVVKPEAVPAGFLENFKELQKKLSERGLVRQLTQVEIERPAEVAIWSEHETPDGKKYYFNSQTNESVWEKPRVLVEFEEHVERMRSAQQQQQQANATDKSAESRAATQADNAAAEASVPKPVDKSKPIARYTIAGTPWLVVFTGDGRSFFYNPSMNLSVWQRPAELNNREEVDRILANPPHLDSQKKKEPAAEKKVKTEIQLGGTPQVDKRKSANLDNENDSESEVDVKRRKTSENGDSVSANEEGSQSQQTKDAAIEAEARAAKERALVPLEERERRFKELLREKNVSAFSSWQKELPKIVFDPRYLLLTSKERKQAFEDWTQERLEEERQERRMRAKQIKENFMALLKQAKLNSKSAFADFASSKWRSDERFKAVEKTRDREDYFREYLDECKRKDRELEELEREKVKSAFYDMLKESDEITKSTKWGDIRRKFEHDKRYAAVDGNALRESWFKDYQRNQLVERQLTEAEVEARKKKEKEARAEQSLKERKRQVDEELASSMMEREKEREQMRKEEAVNTFKALLVDIIKKADVDWHDARKLLKRDSRFEACEPLDREKKEDLFAAHIEDLEKRNRQAFYYLLTETDGITLDSTWKEVRKLIRDDPRYERLPERKREREFDNWMLERKRTAKYAFKELLKETRLITARSRALIDEDSSHREEIVRAIEADKRYAQMGGCMLEDRERILDDYIDRLAQQSTEAENSN